MITGRMAEDDETAVGGGEIAGYRCSGGGCVESSEDISPDGANVSEREVIDDCSMNDEKGRG